MDAETTLNAAPPKSRRRWYQFGLRTLLILVTLAAVPSAWVGWQARLVANRNCLREMAVALLPGRVVDDEKLFALRRWLGDKSCRLIGLDDHASDDTISLYRKAFPEAKVVRMEDFDAEFEGLVHKWRPKWEAPLR